MNTNYNIREFVYNKKTNKYEEDRNARVEMINSFIADEYARMKASQYFLSKKAVRIEVANHIGTVHVVYHVGDSIQTERFF